MGSPVTAQTATHEASPVCGRWFQSREEKIFSFSLKVLKTDWWDILGAPKIRQINKVAMEIWFPETNNLRIRRVLKFHLVKTNIIWYQLYVESKKIVQINLFTKDRFNRTEILGQQKLLVHKIPKKLSEEPSYRILIWKQLCYRLHLSFTASTIKGIKYEVVLGTDRR